MRMCLYDLFMVKFLPRQTIRSHLMLMPIIVRPLDWLGTCASYWPAPGHILGSAHVVGGPQSKAWFDAGRKSNPPLILVSSTQLHKLHENTKYLLFAILSVLCVLYIIVLTCMVMILTTCMARGRAAAAMRSSFSCWIQRSSKSGEQFGMILPE